MVPRRDLAAHITIEDRALPVTQLILLHRGESAGIEPLAATEILAALVEDNVRGSRSGLTSLQDHRFTMLADVVSAVPAYRVTIGEGLSDIEMIAHEIKRLKSDNKN